jgi:hypothetical protein
MEGMLSKSKRQVMRVAAAFHALNYLGKLEAIPTEISSAAIFAATDFVHMCMQHVTFMAGHGDINECIASLVAGA